MTKKERYSNTDIREFYEVKAFNQRIRDEMKSLETWEAKLKNQSSATGISKILMKIHEKKMFLSKAMFKKFEWKITDKRKDELFVMGILTIAGLKHWRRYNTKEVRERKPKNWEWITCQALTHLMIVLNDRELVSIDIDKKGNYYNVSLLPRFFIFPYEENLYIHIKHFERVKRFFEKRDNEYISYFVKNFRYRSKSIKNKEKKYVLKVMKTLLRRNKISEVKFLSELNKFLKEKKK